MFVWFTTLRRSNGLDERHFLMIGDHNDHRWSRKHVSYIEKKAIIPCKKSLFFPKKTFPGSHQQPYPSCLLGRQCPFAMEPRFHFDTVVRFNWKPVTIPFRCCNPISLDTSVENIWTTTPTFQNTDAVSLRYMWSIKSFPHQFFRQIFPVNGWGKDFIDHIYRTERDEWSSSP